MPDTSRWSWTCGECGATDLYVFRDKAAADAALTDHYIRRHLTADGKAKL